MVKLVSFSDIQEFLVNIPGMTQQIIVRPHDIKLSSKGDGPKVKLSS